MRNDLPLMKRADMLSRPFPELRPNGWDGLIVLLVLALAAGSAFAVWGRSGEPAEMEAVVIVNGETAERIALDRPERTERTVVAGGYTLRIAAEGGEVWVESSDCPTQDCVRTGHISKSGQSAVCLPARVIVRLEGGAADGTVDAVLG